MRVDNRESTDWNAHPCFFSPRVTLGQQQIDERGPLRPPGHAWQAQPHQPRIFCGRQLSPQFPGLRPLLAHGCWGPGSAGTASGWEGPRRRRAAPWAPSGAGLVGRTRRGLAWRGVAGAAGLARCRRPASPSSGPGSGSSAAAVRALGRRGLLGASPRGPAWMERPGRGGGGVGSGGGASPGPGEGSAALTPGPAAAAHRLP